MSRLKQKDAARASPPMPPRWKGTDSLQLIYQVNERALTLLSEAVKANTGTWLKAREHRALWSRLSPEALQRAARFPFVILDFHFMDDAWWRAIAHDATERLVPAHAGLSAWPREIAGELLAELLVFAWHTVKLDRRVARLSLGIAPAVADSIAALTPQHLRHIAGHYAAALRLRWEEDTEFWARLATAARDGCEPGLSDIHLYSKLLLCGGLNFSSP